MRAFSFESYALKLFDCAWHEREATARMSALRFTNEDRKMKSKNGKATGLPGATPPAVRPSVQQLRCHHSRHLKGVSGEIYGYLYAMSRRHPERFVWPSIRTIAARIQRSLFWTREKVRELEASGWIESAVFNDRSGWIVLKHETWVAQHKEQWGEDPCSARNKKASKPQQLSCNSAASFLPGENVEKSAKRICTSPDTRQEKTPSSNNAVEIKAGANCLRNGSSQSETANYELPVQGCSSLRNIKNNLVKRIQKDFLGLQDYLTYDKRISGPDRADWENRTRESVREWKATCAITGYTLDLRDPSVCLEFLEAMADVVERKREDDISRARLCMKVIDACMAARPMIPFPPSFVAHKDALWRAEQEKEKRGNGISGQRR
jgi:hypothetical protein